jgi:hypothetical protein
LQTGLVIREDAQMRTTRLLRIVLATTLALAIAASAAQAKTRKVPKGLVGHKLNVVENKLDADAIGYKTVGGGIFGIIVKSDWGVCATIPAAGKPIHGPVKLVVGHFTCGA